MGHSPTSSFCKSEEGDEDRVPKGYEKNRSCTDVVFAALFIVVCLGFAVIGIIAFHKGRVIDTLQGSDYLGHFCGKYDPPSGFESLIPEGAPFQSKTWSKNRYVWYSFPPSFPTLGSLLLYLNVGICVEKCPTVNTTLLTWYINGSSDLKGEDLNTMKVYSYGIRRSDGEVVGDPGVVTMMYDTTPVWWWCLPSVIQPSVVQEMLKSKDPTKRISTLFFEGVVEVQRSANVFPVVCVLGAVMIFALIVVARYFLDVALWVSLVSVLVIPAGGGYCFLRVYLQQDIFGHKLDVGEYRTAFLVATIILWIIAGVYLFLLWYFSTQINLTCAIIKIACRVFINAPAMFLLPVLCNAGAVCVLLWTIFVALGLCNSRYKYFKSPENLMDDLPCSGNSTLAGADLFCDQVRVVMDESFPLVYLILGIIFVFLWIVMFMRAVSFTSVSFVSVFWYFSSLKNSEKHVPLLGIVKGLFWSLFYHTGTLAAGSFVMTIIKFIKAVLFFLITRAKKWSRKSEFVRYHRCCLQCIAYVFERLVSMLSENLYVIMCITSGNFCYSAGSAISKASSSFELFTFLHWTGYILKIGGSCLIAVGCVVVSHFLLGSSLAPDVTNKSVPLILIGIMAFCGSLPFFDVINSSATSLCLCYLHDKDVNRDIGVYYVPTELETYVSDCYQETRLAMRKKKQRAIHDLKAPNP
uniref:Choline transporter-like protein n=1 Tax=Trypanosoma congolense (strain IL3000) TaxID=1068625 RepID=G0UV65_TRYCI|nr:conserved hypothetical protein [Trypanosoma congolense IL3000]